jgi:thiamine pyrophosphate-dependent acetolactate synthase large subunit-like protein
MAIEGNPEFGCELQPIDFAMHARACGATGFTVDDPAQCESVLRQAMAQPGPVVVEAVVDPNEPPLPGNITVEQSIHFAEALAKDEKNRWKVLKTLAENKIREVV